MEKTNDVKLAMNRAVYYLSLQDRSTAQIKAYLEKKGHDKNIINQVIEILQSYGYLDDQKFLEEMLEVELKLRGMGYYSVRKKLLKSGINPDAIEEALNTIDESSQYENAVAWANILFPRLTDSPKKNRDKLYRQLISKGFSHSITGQVISEIDFGFESEENNWQE